MCRGWGWVCRVSKGLGEKVKATDKESQSDRQYNTDIISQNSKATIPPLPSPTLSNTITKATNRQKPKHPYIKKFPLIHTRTHRINQPQNNSPNQWLLINAFQTSLSLCVLIINKFFTFFTYMYKKRSKVINSIESNKEHCESK